jgi:hypothetical protein
MPAWGPHVPLRAASCRGLDGLVIDQFETAEEIVEAAGLGYLSSAAGEKHP